MVQFLANILVYLFGSTRKYFLNVFKKRSAVEAPKPKEGLRFIIDGKEYVLGQAEAPNNLVSKFNQLLAAGVFHQDFRGGFGEWECHVLAKGHCISVIHHPKSGNSGCAFIYGEHNGVLIELGTHFNKLNAITLLEGFMDDLFKVLFIPSTHVEVPEPKPVKKVQAKPEAPSQTHTLRRGKKRRVVSVTKRKDNYHGFE